MDLRSFFRAYWDRGSGWALIGLGLLAILLGWVGVSGTPLPSEQIPFVVSGGVTGIALIGIGATLLLSADLGDEWRKLEALEAAIRERGFDELPDVAYAEPKVRAATRRGRPAQVASKNA